MPGNATAGSSPAKATAPTPWPALIPLGHHAGKPPIPLTRPVTLVGSRHNAHLHLLSRSISKAHALIIHSDAKVYVRDLASRTHVYVNGQEVREAVLDEGDLLKVGSFTFKFQSAAGMKQRAKPDETPAGQIDVDGADFPLPIEQRVMLIGRRPTCDISLVEDSASTAHAVLFSMGGKRYVRDLGSRTGTHVNGQQVRQAEINFGDSIQIGETVMRYQAAAAVDGPAAEVDELEDLVGTAPLLAEDHDAHAADRARAAEQAHDRLAVETSDEARPATTSKRPPAQGHPKDTHGVSDDAIPIDLDLDLDEPEKKKPSDTALIPPVETPKKKSPPKPPVLAHDAIPLVDEEPIGTQQMLVGDNLLKEKLSASATGAGMQAAANEAMEIAKRHERRPAAPTEPEPIPLFDEAEPAPDIADELPPALNEDELLADLMPSSKRIAGAAPSLPPVPKPVAPVAESPQEKPAKRRGWFGLGRRAEEAKEQKPKLPEAETAPAAEISEEPLPHAPFPPEAETVAESPVEHDEAAPELDLEPLSVEEEAPAVEEAAAEVFAESSNHEQPAASVPPVDDELELISESELRPAELDLQPIELPPIEVEAEEPPHAMASPVEESSARIEPTADAAEQEPFSLDGFETTPINEQPPVIAPEVVDEPVAAMPAIEEPVAEEPIVQEPVVEEAVVEEAAVEEPVAEIPVVEAPVPQELASEEPVTVAEEAKAGEAPKELDAANEALVAEPIADITAEGAAASRVVEPEPFGEETEPRILSQIEPPIEVAAEPVTSMEAEPAEAQFSELPTREAGPAQPAAEAELFFGDETLDEITRGELAKDSDELEFSAAAEPEPAAQLPTVEAVPPAVDTVAEISEPSVEVIEPTEATNESAFPLEAATGSVVTSDAESADVGLSDTSFGRQVEEFAGESSGPILDETAHAPVVEETPGDTEAAVEPVSEAPAVAEAAAGEGEPVEPPAEEPAAVVAGPAPEPVAELTPIELPKEPALEEFVAVQDEQPLEAEQPVIAEQEPIALPPELIGADDVDVLLENLDLGIEGLDSGADAASLNIAAEAAIAETPGSAESLDAPFEQRVAETAEQPALEPMPEPVAEAPAEIVADAMPPQIMIPGMPLFDANMGMRNDFVSGMPLMLDELAPPPPTFGRVQVAFGGGAKPKSTIDEGVMNEDEPGPFDNLKVDLDAPVAEVAPSAVEPEAEVQLPAKPSGKAFFQNKLRVPPPPLRRPKPKAAEEVPEPDFSPAAEAPPSGFGQAAQVFGGLSAPVQNIDVFSQGLSADLSNDPFFGNAVKSVAPKDAEKSKRKGRKAPAAVDPQVEELAVKLAEDLGAPPVDGAPSGADEALSLADGGDPLAPVETAATPRRTPLRRSLTTPARGAGAPREMETAHSRAPVSAGGGYRAPGFESAPVPLRRKGHRVAVLFTVMVILMVTTFAAIYLFMKHTRVFEGQVTFENVGKLTDAERHRLQDSQQALLSTEDLRQAAIASLKANHPKISPGFLGRWEDFVKNERRTQWRENPEKVLDTLVYRYVGEDSLEEGAARHRAVLDALVALDAKLVNEAGTQRQLVADLSNRLEQKRKQVEDVQRQRTEAMAVRGKGPAEDALKAALADRDAAKEAWKTAAAAALAVEADMKRLEQAATPAAGATAANVTPDSSGGDPELEKLQKNLEQMTNRLSVARNTVAEQAENARKALENALEQFQQSTSVVQSLMKDNPELSAFVSNAQKLQETTQKLSGDLLERQQKSYDKLIDEKRWVDERLAARRKELWDTDREIKKMKDELAMRERGYGAAVGSGYDDEAKKIKKAMDESLGLIEKRKMEIENDSTLVTLNELAARRQQDITASQKQLEADRKQAETLTKEMEKDFARNAATVEKLPESQRTMAQSMTTKMEALNNARKVYSEALEAKNTEANAGLKMLEESVRLSAGKVEDRRKALASASSQQMTVEERQQRQSALDQKRAAYEAAKKAENDAAGVLLDKEQVANRMTDDDAKAHKAGIEVDKLTSQWEVARKEVVQLTDSLKQAEGIAMSKTYPSAPVIFKPVEMDDHRPMYAVGAMAGLVFVFSLLIAFTGTREPKYETYIPAAEVDPLGGAGVLGPETLDIHGDASPRHAASRHEAVA